MSKMLNNEFSWSLSRDNVFRECPRKYYFHYYGSWGGWEENAPERVRKIYILKKLKNRAIWIGEKVHKCIARSLINLSRSIPVLDPERIIAITLDGMRQDFRNSRNHLYRRDPSSYFGFFEHEYEKPVSDAEWKEAAEQVELCLRNFYYSSVYQNFKDMQKEEFLEIEKFSSFDLDDDKISIKLDFAGKEKDRVIVWDWKTGKSTSSGYSLQMGCYAWYAGGAFGAEPTSVLTRRFDLLKEEIIEQTHSQKSFEELFSYIRGSIMDMKNLLADKSKNIAEEERFAKIAKAPICLNCNFLKICKPDI